MSLKIITGRERKEHVEYRRCFEWKGKSGGFSFPCDQYGNILPGLAPSGDENIRCCRDGTYDVHDMGVVTYRNSYVQPAIGLCACGHELELVGDERGYGIDCVCGRIYNSAGQELAPRNQWEESYDDDY